MAALKGEKMNRPLHELRYTTAPVDYDGFGTKCHGVVGTTCGKDVRLVGIDPDHLNWQDMRYGSGMHSCRTREDWDELVTFGLATWNEVKAPEPSLPLEYETSNGMTTVFKPTKEGRLAVAFIRRVPARGGAGFDKVVYKVKLSTDIAERGDRVSQHASLPKAKTFVVETVG